MAPAVLPTLFTTPNDVFSWMGVPSAELHLDDNNLATGQLVTTTATAAVLGVSISCVALRFPLIKGTTLQFAGGGTAQVAEAVLSASAGVGSTSLSVAVLGVQIEAQAQASDSGLNVALAARLVRACVYGSAQVSLYAVPRYNIADLANSWNVNRWATLLAVEWMAKRCLRPCPEGVIDDAEQVRLELKEVRSGFMNIDGIASRSAGFPFLDNVTVDPSQWNHKIRFQQSISDQAPLQFTGYPDWSDVLGWGGSWGY